MPFAVQKAIPLAKLSPLAQTILTSKKGGILETSQLTAEISALGCTKYTGNDMPVVEQRHSALAKWEVRTSCKYCKKSYTYSLLLGDNMHSCGKRGCVLRAMRDMF